MRILLYVDDSKEDQSLRLSFSSRDSFPFLTNQCNRMKTTTPGKALK